MKGSRNNHATNKRPAEVLDSKFPCYKEIAEETKKFLKRKGIKSPDTQKMFSFSPDNGKTTYFFNTKDEMIRKKNKFVK